MNGEKPCCLNANTCMGIEKFTMAGTGTIRDHFKR